MSKIPLEEQVVDKETATAKLLLWLKENGYTGGSK
jgi:hypothetical protein